MLQILATLLLLRVSESPVQPSRGRVHASLVDPNYPVVHRFSHISRIFERCHLQFLFLNGEPTSTHTNRILRSFHTFVHAMDNRVSISIHILPFLFRNRPVLTSNQHTRYNSTSNQACLIHVYTYSEIEFHDPRIFHRAFKRQVRALMMYDVWPNHFIRFGKLYNGEYEFVPFRSYNYFGSLSQIYVRGI